MQQVIGVLAAVALTVAGILALRSVWAAGDRSRFWILGGWVALAAAILGWASVAADDKAVALACLVPSLIAYAVIALKAEWTRKRTGRRREAGADIEPAPGNGWSWQATARLMLAGPLSAVAAGAVGAAISLCPLWSEPSRIVAAGLLAPAVWAVGMCWSLSDSRLGRVAIGLGATTLVAGMAAL